MMWSCPVMRQIVGTEEQICQTQAWALGRCSCSRHVLSCPNFVICIDGELNRLSFRLTPFTAEVLEKLTRRALCGHHHPRQCHSIYGFPGDNGRGEVKESRKVKDASEEPLCSLCIYTARGFHPPAAPLPGPQRIRRGNLGSEHQSYFYLCAGQGDAAAAGRGSVLPDTQNWILRRN